MMLKRLASGIWWAARSFVSPKMATPLPATQPIPIAEKPKRRYSVGNSVDGRAGETVTMQVKCDAPFKGEKMVLSEDSDDGMSTLVQGLFVGNKPQLPTFQYPILSRFFAADVLDNEMDMDLCAPGLFITLQVSFLVDCKISMAILGHVPDEKLPDVPVGAGDASENSVAQGAN